MGKVKIKYALIGVCRAVIMGCEREKGPTLNLDGIWDIYGAYFYSDTSDVIRAGFAFWVSPASNRALI